MDTDLNLTGIQYNIALSIFFIPYILLEVPSNILLKLFKRPSTYIGILVVSWGTIMTFTGCQYILATISVRYTDLRVVVKNFAGLMVCRVLLGVAEVRCLLGAFLKITLTPSQRQVFFQVLCI